MLRFDREKLIQKMAERCINQRQLSAEAGLHVNTLCHIMKGVARPQEITVLRLASALHCDPDELKSDHWSETPLEHRADILASVLPQMLTQDPQSVIEQLTAGNVKSLDKTYQSADVIEGIEIIKKALENDAHVDPKARKRVISKLESILNEFSGVNEEGEQDEGK